MRLHIPKKGVHVFVLLLQLDTIDAISYDVQKLRANTC